MPFYRLNSVDFYNPNMDNFDLDDQLHNHYINDYNCNINRKLWLAIYWRGFQVQMINCCVCVLKFNMMAGNKLFDTPYEYTKAIAPDWTKPDFY